MAQKEKNYQALRDLETFPPDLDVLTNSNNNNLRQPSEEFNSDPRFVDPDPQGPQDLPNLTPHLEPPFLAQDNFHLEIP